MMPNKLSLLLLLLGPPCMSLEHSQATAQCRREMLCD